MMHARRALGSWLVPVTLVVLLLTGCNGEAPPQDYVARVGDAYLLPSDLEQALETVGPAADSSYARQQVIEQWITNQLLYQEAQRQGLREHEDVRRRLRESERAVMIDALVSSIYEADTENVSNADVRSYFERHREQLRLREPFVRLRYLATSSEDSASAAAEMITASRGEPAPDTVWATAVDRYADDPDASLGLASNYYPESRLFPESPALRDVIHGLRAKDRAVVRAVGDQYHVVQVIDRVQPGTLPEYTWVKPEIERVLAIDARKQMFDRQVQRLRTEAEARDALDVR